MPTEVYASESRTDRRKGWRPGGSPLAVLARFPWIASELESGRNVDLVTRPPGLTHFEYLMGEFGLYGAAAVTPPERTRPPTPVAAAIQKSSLAVEPVTHPGVTIAPPSHEPRKRDSLDWTEVILRLDAAIEPYSRAIVLLVLLAVAAFTLLLLRASPEETPARAPHVPAQPLATPLQPQPKPVSKIVSRQIEEEAPAVVAAGPKPPTAQGPASVPPRNPSPPLAALGEEIMPASPKAAAETSPYPNPYPYTDLPTHRSGPPAKESRERSPLEARLQGSVTPIPSYK